MKHGCASEVQINLKRCYPLEIKRFRHLRLSVWGSRFYYNNVFSSRKLYLGRQQAGAVGVAEIRNGPAIDGQFDLIRPVYIDQRGLDGAAANPG